MNPTEICFLSLARLAQLIERRELSPVEVVEAHLARIRETEPKLNSFLTLNEEGALAAAWVAEHEISARRYLGPLHGVPISLKDLYDTGGIKTTGGSRILADRVPAEDGMVSARFARAGAVLLGKNNLHEFAFGVTTTNPHYGATHNPWHLDRIPGGSSGGSGSAVAAGQSVISMGSDTGGSVRIPASLCGVTRLKPTYGRVSRARILALSWSLDHAGPLTRSAEDAAIVLSLISGYDPAAPASIDAPVPDYRAALAEGAGGLRVGLPRGFFFEGLDAEIAAAVGAAIEELGRLGAKLTEVELPEAARFTPTSSAILYAEAAAIHAEDIRSRPEDYGEDVRERMRLGMLLTATEYVQGQRARRALTVGVADVMREVDLLVTPMVPVQTPTIEGFGVDAQIQRARLTRFSRAFNVTGQPAVSIPCGFTTDGMPIGLQLAGRPLEDGLVLRAAHAYQQATDWHTHRPPL